MFSALSFLVSVCASPSFQDLGVSVGNDAACWVDVDNDGWTDLCTGGWVWHNRHGKSFERGAQVGSVVAADFDNDGYADLFSWSTLKLHHNDLGRGFTEFELPSLPTSVSRGACWGDFNGDGHVDLYVGGYEDWDKGLTYPSTILMSEAGKSFRLAWQRDTDRTRGVTACDFDRDDDLDVYASNYRLQPNRLWLNDGKGTFADVAPARNAVATSEGFPGGHSIGAAWGDFDNDGEIDLFAGNFAHVDSRGDQPKSRFLRNIAGTRVFEDKGTCGVFYQESYATPATGDTDNDGDLDLFFTTVYAPASFDKPNYPVLFQNRGAFVFEDGTAASGLQSLPPTSQAAWCDFDNDGRLDLVTAGKIYRNTGPTASWIGIQLEGDGKSVNRSAIGAQVRIKLGASTMTRQVEAGTGEGNQNDLRLHLGLGSHKGRVNVEVTWPDGKRQVLRRAGPGKVHRIKRR